MIGELKIKEAFAHVKEWFFEFPREKLSAIIESDTNRGFKKKLFGTPFDRPGKEGWLKNLKSSSSQNDLSKKRKYEE